MEEEEEEEGVVAFGGWHFQVFFESFFLLLLSPSNPAKDEGLQRTRMVLALDNHLGNAKVTNQPPPR